MDDLRQLVSTFVDSVAFIMAMVFVVSLLQRKSENQRLLTFLRGAVFSAGVMFTMANPIDLGTAGIYDMRGLLIGTAGALLGPVAGLMAMLTALAIRLGIGGHGLAPGILSIAVAFAAGLIWRRFVPQLNIASWKKALLLGVGISGQAVGIFVLPRALWDDLIIGLVPYLLFTNIIGAFLLFHLIRAEISFVSAAVESRKDASTDHLTGLLNRRGLDLVYPEMASRIENTRGWGLLYFDIDRFKHINDTYGHGVGDAVLRHVAERITGNLRPHDVFARLGGDEFVVILNRIDRDEAERIANRCRAVVAGGGFIHQGEILPISTSIGGIWMFDQIEIERFLEEADKALYDAKTSGRDKVVFKVGLGGMQGNAGLQPA